VADSITPSISSGSRASTASALALARGNPPDRFLRYVGIEVTFGRERRARTPIIRLTAAPENVGPRPSAPSALSDPEITPLRSNGLPADKWRTVDGAADDHQPDTAATVRTKPLKCNAETIADDADTNGARRSGAAELPPV
jgi:hypothetical protein